MKKLATSMLLACALIGFSSAQGAPSQAAEKPAAKESIYDVNRDAAKDIADAVKKAAKKNKRVLIDVGGDWCIWCHRLDKTFHQDKEIADYLKSHFVLVKVNFSEGHENKAVLSKYPTIPGYPHLFVLDKSGKLLQSQDTGLLESGDHHDHDKVIAFLRKWAA